MIRAALLLLAPVLALAPRTAGAQQAPAAPARESSFERSTVEVEPSRGPIGAVVIDNRYGDVRVEGHDGDTVVIHAYKRAPDDAALERLKVSLVADPRGGLRIGTRLAEGREGARLAAGSIRIDLVVQAPRDAAVSAKLFKGAVQVTGMENGADLETEEGDIEVRHASGRIETDAARGHQQFTEVVGDLQARGQFGDVDLDRVRGKRLETMLHQGKVTGRRITSRNLTIWVTRGDIRIEGIVLAGGTWRLMTRTGNIEVKLAQGTPLSLRARARNGEVSLPSALRAARRDDRGWTLASSQQRARTQAMLELAANIGNIAVSF
jgi:DUF4097 and DUF4098 domain-containing protein YvlB